MSRLVQQLESMFLPNGDASGEEEAAGGQEHARTGRPASLPRRRIVLSCAQCGGRNYRKTKSRREGLSPLSLSKFCSTCNAHTQHREAV